MARAKSPRRGKIEYELYIICSLSNPEPFKMDEMAGDKQLAKYLYFKFPSMCYLNSIIILPKVPIVYQKVKFLSSNLDRIFIIAFWMYIEDNTLVIATEFYFVITWSYLISPRILVLSLSILFMLFSVNSNAYFA